MTDNTEQAYPPEKSGNQDNRQMSQTFKEMKNGQNT